MAAASSPSSWAAMGQALQSLASGAGRPAAAACAAVPEKPAASTWQPVTGVTSTATPPARNSPPAARSTGSLSAEAAARPLLASTTVKGAAGSSTGVSPVTSRQNTGVQTALSSNINNIHSVSIFYYLKQRFQLILLY